MLCVTDIIAHVLRGCLSDEVSVWVFVDDSAFRVNVCGLCFNKCAVYLACLPDIKYLSLILSGVALLYSVDARLRLDLVCIEGLEGHRESLWYQ